jgi:hypothetical protein
VPWPVMPAHSPYLRGCGIRARRSRRTGLSIRQYLYPPLAAVENSSPVSTLTDAPVAARSDAAAPAPVPPSGAAPTHEEAVRNAAREPHAGAG